MDVYILNESFELVKIVDDYISLIWNERYVGYGEFELYMTASYEALITIQKNCYVQLKDSESTMIVEDVEVINDIENGSTLKFSGRGIESILDRRIIWVQTTLNGNLQEAIQRLLNENVISPSASERRINNVIFQASTDPKITSLEIAAQYTGDNLYEVIEDICTVYGIGFKMILNDQNQYVFSLYHGVDRSYDQNVNSYVIFSSQFENIINSNYLESQKTLKNVTLVGGEGEGIDRHMVTVGTTEGLYRRELFTDARDIQSKTDNGSLTTSQYDTLLRQRGEEKLAENKEVQTFEGEIDASRMFVYNKDFFKGDIVQISSEFGIEFKVRIDEIVRSIDENGIEMYPTFSVM